MTYMHSSKDKSKFPVPIFFVLSRRENFEDDEEDNEGERERYRNRDINDERGEEVEKKE